MKSTVKLSLSTVLSLSSRLRNYNQHYYLETNLYDAKTEELIWSAQSQTYNPSNINSFLKGYLKSIKRKMIDDGLIAK